MSDVISSRLPPRSRAWQASCLVFLPTSQLLLRELYLALPSPGDLTLFDSPGMGLNAYFTFQVVGYNASGPISYRLALTAVFVEGLIFIFLALTGMRQWLVKLIPATIKTATGVGIGLFLTEIGLSYSAGIGAITGGWTATPLALGGCPEEFIDEVTGMCSSGQMSNPKVNAILALSANIY